LFITFMSDVIISVCWRHHSRVLTSSKMFCVY